MVSRWNFQGRFLRKINEQFFEAVNMIVLVLCCKDLHFFCIFLLFSNQSSFIEARSNRGSRGSQVDILFLKISHFVFWFNSFSIPFNIRWQITLKTFNYIKNLWAPPVPQARYAHRFISPFWSILRSINQSRIWWVAASAIAHGQIRCHQGARETQHARK